MSTLAERLKIAMEGPTPVKPIDLARACGIKQPSVSDWLSGKTKKLEGANLLAASRRLGVSPEWLATGKGSMRHEEKAISHTIKGSASTDQCFEIHQYQEVGGSMGVGVLLRDQPGQITSWRVTEEWALKNIPAHTGKENLCIVTGFGDSMRGMFNSGDPLIVDRGVTKLEFDAVYFFRVGDEGFIKRLQRIPGQGIRVISKNPDYESWTITPEMDFEVFGRVLKVWKSEEF